MRFVSRFRFFKIVLAIIFLFVQFVPAAIVRAATATPATYLVTRHAVGTAANHEFRFVTPTGVNALTDTIVLTYASGFNLTSIAVGDIDFLHGPTTGLETNETLAGSPAAGVWGVSVGATTITFTAPTNAGAGEINGNDIVTIRIGTNAVGGTNQIVNPTSPQIARIELDGTFGDEASVDVPILYTDAVTVSATVGASSTGGGGGGGGDTSAPIISGVQAINITSSTASIVWQTDEFATSIVEYGLDNSYGSGTLSNGALVGSHQMDLSGLSPGTLYHFRVSSRDAASNLAQSGDFTFTTLGDTQSPLISNVAVVDITDTSARVTWQTNEPATSRVDYGVSTSYGLSLSDSSLVFSHSILITGLSPFTLYNFFVTSQDAAANRATSTNGTFTTTGDTTPPANPFNFDAVGGNGIVNLSWNLPSDPDLAGVRIVRRTDTFPTGPLDGTLIFNGLATSTADTGVVNGTTYFYGIFAYDTNGNFSSGAVDSATPQGGFTPENTPGACSNGLDDDGDAAIDCLDIECSAFPSCAGPTPENTPAACSNGVDDDADGQPDCQDSECSVLAICLPPPNPTPENTNPLCSNGLDDDTNGFSDCADSSCSLLLVCAPPIPNPPATTTTEPIPENSSSTPSGQTIVISPEFYGAGGTVPLVPDGSGEFGAAAGSAVLVVVPVTGLGALPDKAYVTVNGQSYNLVLSPDGTAYRGTFIVPGVGRYPVSVAMTFTEGGAAVSDFTLLSQAGGQVVAETLFGTNEEAVPGAKVTLFVEVDGVWVPWNGAPYGQGSTQLTNGEGGFLFIVPSGRYYVQVEKEGYATVVSTPRFISKGVFGERVGLVSQPPPLSSVVSSTAPLLENIANVAENVVAQVVSGATTIRTIIQQPEVQEVTQNVISPALFGVAVVNAAAALPLFNSLAFLQYLFTQPILILGRRRKKKWGVVYNSLTKQPVELAIVRLIHHATNVVVQTVVTDKYGRYVFSPKPGTYRLEIVKVGYAFPTQYLKGKEQDVDFTDLYHGSIVDVAKNGLVVVNIPVDPVVAEEAPRSVLLRKAWHAFQQQFALLTVIASVVALAIIPSVQVALITLGQVGLYLIFRRLGAAKAAKEWGVVFDATSHAAIDRVVVRIFDKKFNKLLETQVTDANGKYGFFVRRNVYYITAEKQGYVKYVSPDIDLTDKDEALVDQNVPMKKVMV